MKTLTTLSLVAVFVALGSVASAVPIAFGSEAAWLAALGGATVTTEDFEGSPLGALGVGTVDIGLFSVTTNAPGEPNFNAIVGGGSINGSRQLQIDLDADNNTQADFVNFDVGTAIGFSGIFNSTLTGDRLTVTVNGTTIQLDSVLISPGSGFFGVVDTNPFGSIQFGVENQTSFGEAWAVDNFALAQPQETPEPASLALLGIGLLATVAGRRGRKSS